MDYSVILSPSAITDIRDIVRYISLDAPDRALRFGDYLISRTEILSKFPEIGRMIPEFGNIAIREIVVRSYRVIYRVNHERRTVEIVRFWHGARGFPDIGA